MSNYEWVKRVYSFLFSLISLFFLWPLFLAITIAIRLDSPGPIIYKQLRVGKNGKIFGQYKFRTMYMSSDKYDVNKYVEKLVSENNNAGNWYRNNDPRGTRVGRVLRRLALNELPSIFNILEGDMNLVGPRPFLLFEAEKLTDELREVLNTVPGMTGLGTVEMFGKYGHPEEIYNYEITYVRNQSLYLDLKILLRTVYVVISNKNAY